MYCNFQTSKYCSKLRDNLFVIKSDTKTDNCRKLSILKTAELPLHVGR